MSAGTSPNASAPDDADTTAALQRARSQIAALEQLLEAHERTSLEQAAHLERSLLERDALLARERAARVQLQENERRLGLALDAGGMGSWEWDIVAGRVIWSPEEERLYGIAPGTFSGSIEEYRERIHPDDREASLGAVRAALGSNAQMHHVMHRIIRPDGEVRWLDSHARFVYAEDGRPLRLVGVSTEITERKRAEDELAEAHSRLQEQASELEQSATELEVQAEELEQQVEQSQALTEELEQANEHLAEATRATERAWREAELSRGEVETLNHIGGALASELQTDRIAQTVTDATTSLTGAQFGAFFYNVVDKQGEKLTLYALAGAPREAFENFGHPRPTPVFAPTFYGTGIMRSDDITADPRYGQMGPHHGMPPGHLPVRSYLAVPVVSRTGDVIGGLFFGHSDVGVFTSRAERLVIGVAAWAAVAMDNARLYAAEQSARTVAEAANKAKSEFLANMSHELRTPLNAIGGYSDLILAGIRGPVTEAQVADLERIKRSQRHLLSLINDILNFAKIEAGRVRLDLADVSLNEVLGQMEALVAPQLLEKRIAYEYRCRDPEFTAHVDPERLQQILLNLLSNAVKFTPEGGEILVECAAAPGFMLVRVQDTGVGIPADKLEQIFEPFVQLDRGRSSSNAGTGLGLAISRELARAMGGELRVASEVGVGSTFILTLPRG